MEIVKRDGAAGIANEFNLSQTMLRIKDPKKSIPFYERLGMTLCREVHMSDFSLYFLSCLPDGVTVSSTPPPAPPARRRNETLALALSVCLSRARTRAPSAACAAGDAPAKKQLAPRPGRVAHEGNACDAAAGDR